MPGAHDHGTRCGCEESLVFRDALESARAADPLLNGVDTCPICQGNVETGHAEECPLRPVRDATRGVYPEPLRDLDAARAALASVRAESQELAAHLARAQRAEADAVLAMQTQDGQFAALVAERDAARADLERERAETARLREALEWIRDGRYRDGSAMCVLCGTGDNAHSSTCPVWWAAAAISPAAEPRATVTPPELARPCGIRCVDGSLCAMPSGHGHDVADVRCTRCGWPMAKTKEEGCVPGNCSWRGPLPAAEPAPPKEPTP